MKYTQLRIFIVFIFISLNAMESSPFKVLQDSQNPIKTAMLAKIETKEQAEELLDASNKMIEEHKKFIRAISKLAPLLALLKQLRHHALPQLKEWVKEVQILESQLTQNGICALTLQQLIDETLENSDGNMSHSASIALRYGLTRQLIKYNTSHQTHIHKLSQLFGSQLTNIQFQKFLTLDEFKQQLKKEKNPEDKLIKACAYREFLEEAPHQLEFFNLALKTQTILGLPTKNNAAENMNMDLIPQLLKYCIDAIHTLQNKSLEEIKKNQNQTHLKSIDKQIAQKLELIFQDDYKAYCRCYNELLRYERYFKTQFLPHLKNYIDGFKKHYEKLLPEKKEAKQPLFQTKAITVAKFKDISDLPPCRIDIKPHTATDIHRLKQEYPHFMQFRLQEDIVNELTQQRTSILYFLSRNILTTKPTGTPTSTFIYEIGKTPMNQFLPVKDNRLYYTKEGNYYFINHADSSEKAYPIEYIAALCFPTQQSTQSKIEPQVRNSSDNKK